MEQKTAKCIKCQQDIPAQNGVNKTNGFICNNCIRKARKRKIVITGSILLLILAGAIIYLSATTRKSPIGFDGATNIQDTISITAQSPEVEFALEKTVALANVVTPSQAVDNLESFKRIFAKNLKDATEHKANGITIPAIFVLFDFESANISSSANNLLREYAKTYLQTNRQATILVQGYACNYGSDAVNNTISKQRADAIKSALVSYGVSDIQIETQWFGKSKNKDFSYPKMKDYRRVVISIK